MKISLMQTMRMTVRKSSLPDSLSRLEEIDQAALWQPDCFAGSENSPAFSSTPPLALPFCRYPSAIRQGVCLLTVQARR